MAKSGCGGVVGRGSPGFSDGFSKKAANHAHSVAIHFMHYNFVRIHQSLRITPAMAAGVTTKLWVYCRYGEGDRGSRDAA
jgi:hypothetical protein